MPVRSRSIISIIEALQSDTYSHIQRIRATEADVLFSKLKIYTVKNLYAKLGSLPVQVRRQIILAIGRVHLRHAAPHLLRVIYDDDSCRHSAAVALASLLDNVGVVRVVRRILPASDPFVRSALIQTVMMSEARPPDLREFVRIAASIANDTHEIATLRSDAIEAIALTAGRIDRRTRIFRSLTDDLVQLLSDPIAEVRATACYAVGLLRIESGVKLLKLMARSDKELAFGSMTIALEARKGLRRFNRGQKRV